MHFLGLAGIPRRYANFPDRFLFWNTVARIGSLITSMRVIFFMATLWEGQATQRPVLARKYLRTFLELTHHLPPISHRFDRVPQISMKH